MSVLKWQEWDSNPYYFENENKRVSSVIYFKTFGKNTKYRRKAEKCQKHLDKVI